MLIKNKELLKNISLLYVEDNEDTAEEVSIFLSHFFVNLHVATNGVEGLEKFKEHKADIVLTDIQMPLMDGITMAKQIKQIEPKTQVVISSAFNESKYLKDAINVGVAAYLIKPINFKNLLNILEDILSNIYHEVELNKKYKELEIAKNEAIKANKSKSEFLANMSHEIRTPLNAIMGFISLLKEDEINEEKVKYLNTINSSSLNLLEIINNILDFSKVESNQIDLENRDFNAIKEIGAEAELFNALMLEKDIKFIVNISPDFPTYLHSDALRIKQVVTNLLSNALKFTPCNKTIILNISYIDSHLHVSVKDEGIGIAQDKQKSVFEAFTQADSSTTREYGGTGLGLTISYKLIEALGGELKVKSEVGIGSEFYFSIPIKTVQIEKSEIDKIDKDIQLCGHILLVEDNKANQMFMKIILKKLGLTFDIASNGAEAVEKFCNVKYDTILMDENMPIMNGIEATDEILKIEKKLNASHTPIIALTANAIKGDRERFLAAGMDEYITKPADKKKLSTVLKEFLKSYVKEENND
jgi:two-component system, sensor histidine kinase